METVKTKKCVKIRLPNGKVVDVLDSLLKEIGKWIQDDKTKPESGGFIVGYQHERTGNVSLEAASPPYDEDEKGRIHFGIKDLQHFLFLEKAKRNRSYYMGVWHTHPQANPHPSAIDWEDWYETLRQDKTGCQFIFFIIAGTKTWRMWIGNRVSGEITLGHECAKNSDGVYIED